MSTTVSIIVPVYNTAPYLERCISSILRQTFFDFEVLLVDDGSTDGSSELCENFVRRDGRVRCIHRKNGGLSAARNTGLDHAVGDYVTFVDSDDYVRQRYIDTLFHNLIDYDADISVCNFFETVSHDVELMQKEKIKIFQGREALLDMLYQKTFNTAVWGKMYIRKNLKGIRFREGRINEDILFNYEAFQRSEKTVVSNLVEYIYIRRPRSLMHSGFRKESMDYLRHTGLLVRYADRENNNEERDAALSLYLWANVNILVNLDRGKVKERRFVRKNLTKYSKYVLRNPSVRKRNKAVILFACYAEDILRMAYRLKSNWK